MGINSFQAKNAESMRQHSAYKGQKQMIETGSLLINQTVNFGEGDSPFNTNYRQPKK